MGAFHIIVLSLKNPPVFKVVASDVWTKLGTEIGKNILMLNFCAVWIFCFVF